MILVWFRT